MGVAWKDNIDVADALERVADLLEEQDAMPFRVGAYRKAADTIAKWPQPVAELLAEEGEAGLRKLPGVGKSIAAAMAELIRTGQLSLLQRLESEHSPEQLLASVPGIGAELARRIHDELGVRTLEELEQAAHDGRLERVEGFGPRRSEQVRELLGARLGRSGAAPHAGAKGGMKAPGRTWACCSRWTRSTGGARAQASCAGLHRAGSIPLAKHGCPYSARSWRDGTSARSSPTPRWPTSRMPPMTGWCSTSTRKATRANAPSSPRMAVRSTADVWCADGRWSASRTTAWSPRKSKPRSPVPDAPARQSCSEM
ncbi:helix-hairpin-helix domain-containing protein [Myxococcus sp. MxC21-1]|uniref:helix-hairpin-helix domain-containing protein n=1 Tax=Myxococcus sp. MxC21-1 TaxID=3041439 RepID=UPI00292FC2ED|nr:helix-hairpin-helix domain-containing protein [Myxococcus sp. MxC21-1]WNZ60720.1 helix-hairpin-helix domain-containing protein [Myxococcus sp. MxC21-1]